MGLVILTVLVGPASAQTTEPTQTIEFGVKGGTPILDPFILSSPSGSFNNYSFSKERYTVGPTFELGLPYHLSVEADALYKRLDYVSYPFGFTTFQASTGANSWEFPVLVKRHFFSGIISPFGDLGGSFRHVGGSTTFSNSAVQASQSPLELVHSWSTGFAGGAGVDFVVGSFHVSPELRYTRWMTGNFSSSNGVLNSNLNSLDAIIGLTFRMQ